MRGVAMTHAASWHAGHDPSRGGLQGRARCDEDGDLRRDGHACTIGLPTWDGEPGADCRPIKQIGVDGEAAQVSLLTLGHALRHPRRRAVPLHPGAGGVESLPLDALVGPCRVVEVGSVAADRAG